MSNRYENPLCSRYAGEEMQFIFSDDNKFATWRRLWLTLAESQKALGLNISDTQISELQANIENINYEAAARYEYETRHDVIAHIRAFGDLCPTAAPVIHLGATSCYVGDNTDIIVQHSALTLIKKLLLNTVSKLYGFAEKYKALPCLGYTHFQAAQPTTLGKRAALWIQDLLFDLETLDFVLDNLRLLGCKGTTGTGASFLHLFDGDHSKVLALENMIATKMGFAKVYPVSGQTYSRKVDFMLLTVLSGIAQSAHKFSNDIRLLSHLKAVEEPFTEGQVGSSAMAYKRNPMRSERMAALARYVMVDALNPALTAAEQWLERTLDDSANRRISIPQSFLAIDGILRLYINVAGGLTVYPKVLEKQLREEAPFILTENLLMHCVKKGGNRQALHERIRVHSVEAAKKIKLEGCENDLFARILSDSELNLTESELNELLEEGLTGSAEQQTEAFLQEVREILEKNKGLLGAEVEIKV